MLLFAASIQMTWSSHLPPTNSDSVFTMQRSPLGAMVRSAILPGFGQFYNNAYWKIPVILGLGGYLLYEWVDNHDTFAKYRDEYSRSITSIQPAGDLNLKLYREFYRDQRDTFGWYFGILYFAQILDAFVDAHLFDFDVSPTTQGNVSISLHSIRIRIQW